TWNAFAPFVAQRNMMFGFQALGLVGYVVSLFWFDERGDGLSRFVSVVATACIAVIISGFITGHANAATYSRFHEAIFYIVAMAIQQILLPAIIVPFCEVCRHAPGLSCHLCKHAHNIESRPICAEMGQQQ